MLHGSTVSGAPVLGPACRRPRAPRRPGPDLHRAARERHQPSRGRRAARPRRSSATRRSFDPTATVGPASHRRGSVLLAHVDVTADASRRRSAAIMPQVVAMHDVRVADFATSAAAVRVGGGREVGREAYVGSSSCLREGVQIGTRAMVGMGWSWSTTSRRAAVVRRTGMRQGPARLPGRAGRLVVGSNGEGSTAPSQRSRIAPAPPGPHVPLAPTRPPAATVVIPAFNYARYRTTRREACSARRTSS